MNARRTVRAYFGHRLALRSLTLPLAGLLLVLALILGSPHMTSAQSPWMCASMTLLPQTLPNSTMGADYHQTFYVQELWDCCYSYPFVYSLISGSLPTGLTLSPQGVLSGTTVRPGSYNLGVRVQDSNPFQPTGYFCEGAYTIVVEGANQQPTFTAGSDVTVLQDGPPYSAPWASNISEGGPQDVGQALTFYVSNDNNALFSVQPAIAADGTLSFTLAPDGNGIATVSVYLDDNGGTANDGIDRSATVTFQITVTPFDQPQKGPIFKVSGTESTKDNACTKHSCTLREAIEAANTYGGNNPSGPASTIELAAGAVYAIDEVDNRSGDNSPNGLPQITTNITINGHGAHIARSAAAPNFRLIDVGGGFLTLNGVSLENGRADLSQWGNTAGGAILDRGQLVVKNCYFEKNEAQHGGAIFNPGGPSAWIYNSTFYQNKATAGGAIYTGGSLDLYSNTFFDNRGDTPSTIWLSYGPTTKYNFYNNLFVSPGSTAEICYMGGPDTVIAAGGNLATDTTCGKWFGVTTVDAVKAVLPPALNGGQTKNVAIQAGSTAIDVGNATACQNANIGGGDQRRYGRFFDGNGDRVASCDAGAYEYGSALLPPPAPTLPGPPEVSIVLGPATPDGSHGWYRGPVTVTPQATSDTSTVVEVRCVLDPQVVPATYADLPQDACPFIGGKQVGTDGAHTFYMGAMETTGMRSGVVSASFKIDATAPVIACPAAGPFMLNTGEQAVGPAGADAAVSGLDEANSTLTGTVNTDSTGPKTVTFKATDLAGNQASRECTYTVLGGFYPPVDASALNTVNAGSAVPVKFSLEGATGLSGMAAGYPASQVVSCESRTPAGALEQAKTAGESGLTYDPVAGLYQMAWKTDKAWAGTCRALVIRLANGMEFRAYFQLK